jgi:hypothetical protein
LSHARPRRRRLRARRRLTVTGTRRHEQRCHRQRHVNHTVPHIPTVCLRARFAYPAAVRLPSCFQSGNGPLGTVATSGPTAGQRLRPAAHPPPAKPAPRLLPRQAVAEGGRPRAVTMICTTRGTTPPGWPFTESHRLNETSSVPVMGSSSGLTVLRRQIQRPASPWKEATSLTRHDTTTIRRTADVSAFVTRACPPC